MMYSIHNLYSFLVSGIDVDVAIDSKLSLYIMCIIEYNERGSVALKYTCIHCTV